MTNAQTPFKPSAPATALKGEPEQMKLIAEAQSILTVLMAGNNAARETRPRRIGIRFDEDERLTLMKSSSFPTVHPQYIAAQDNDQVVAIKCNYNRELEFIKYRTLGEYTTPDGQTSYHVRIDELGRKAVTVETTGSIDGRSVVTQSTHFLSPDGGMLLENLTKFPDTGEYSGKKESYQLSENGGMLHIMATVSGNSDEDEAQTDSIYEQVNPDGSITTFDPDGKRDHVPARMSSGSVPGFSRNRIPARAGGEKSC